MRSFAILVVTWSFSTVACAPTDAGWRDSFVESVPVGEGQTVADLGKDSVRVILIYDPADCFSCYGVLPDWLRMERERPDMVSVVFTRPPEGPEVQELLKYRLSPDYTADPPIASWELTTPGEMLYMKSLMSAFYSPKGTSIYWPGPTEIGLREQKGDRGRRLRSWVMAKRTGLLLQPTCGWGCAPKLRASCATRAAGVVFSARPGTGLPMPGPTPRFPGAQACACCTPDSSFRYAPVPA